MIPWWAFPSPDTRAVPSPLIVCGVTPLRKCDVILIEKTLLGNVTATSRDATVIVDPAAVVGPWPAEVFVTDTRGPMVRLHRRFTSVTRDVWTYAPGWAVAAVPPPPHVVPPAALALSRAAGEWVPASDWAAGVYAEDATVVARRWADSTSAIRTWRRPRRKFVRAPAASYPLTEAVGVLDETCLYITMVHSCRTLKHRNL